MTSARACGALVVLLVASAWSAVAKAAAGSFIRSEDHRVAAVTHRLAHAGASLCSQRYPLTGLLFHHLPEYELSDQRQVIALYRLDRGPGVLTVLDNSPAAEAGLVAGDTILAINGRPLPSPPDRRNKGWREAVHASEAAIEEELRLGPVKLLVLRDGRELETTLGSVPACPARVRLARSSQVNAFASGRNVVITTGLLGFIGNDDELAVAIAHELAHNILGHPERLRAQRVPRGLLRGIGKNAARVRATEEEADRLAVRLLWMGGYDVGAAIPFWRRFYARYDTMPQLFRTHPGLKARERLINEAIAELSSRPAASP